MAHERTKNWTYKSVTSALTLVLVLASAVISLDKPHFMLMIRSTISKRRLSEEEIRRILLARISPL